MWVDHVDGVRAFQGTQVARDYAALSEGVVVQQFTQGFRTELGRSVQPRKYSVDSGKERSP